ncbi:MAG: hypothetical protein H6767_07810 [Candidatus Peribacteria bacterium]|nr:MAG: hypothetical protein H6767_07810 [Candidatus Peribacteria bacterium]
MKKLATTSLAGIMGLAVVAQTHIASAAINFGENNVDQDLRGSNQSADSAVQSLISNFMAFLYLIAVVYALWGGFNILTAGGEEEKVKKGKTVLIQAVIGLLVIFLADSIINFVVSKIFGGGAA